MADFRFRLNPRAGELPHCSAVLNGRGTRYEINDYRTTLSLKSVVRGAARYHTPQGHYLVTPDSFLILNDGQRYSLEFEGRRPRPDRNALPVFPVRLPGTWRRASGVGRYRPGRAGARFLRAAVSQDRRGGRGARRTACRIARPASFCAVARRSDVRAGASAGRVASRRCASEAESFPGLRPATRMELYRRLYRGRDLSGVLLRSAAHSGRGGARGRHSRRSIFSACSSWHSGALPCSSCRQTRLEAARRLLAHTGDDVTAICFAVGFESLGSFSWLFRKRFGVSPRNSARKDRARKSQD